MRTSMCAFTVTPSSFRRAAWRSRATITCSRAFFELVSGAALEAERPLALELGEEIDAVEQRAAQPAAVPGESVSLHLHLSEAPA